MSILYSVCLSWVQMCDADQTLRDCEEVMFPRLSSATSSGLCGFVPEGNGLMWIQKMHLAILRALSQEALSCEKCLVLVNFLALDNFS